MTGFKFPRNITDHAARITTYSTNIFERSDAVGYVEFKSESPKHTMELILDHFKPAVLKSTMQDQVKVEPGLKISFKSLFSVLKVVLQPAEILENS